MLFRVFGFETFGTVFGLANTISGLFNLVLRPIDVLVKTTLGGNYTPVNLALLVAGFASSALLSGKIYVGIKNKNNSS